MMTVSTRARDLILSFEGLDQADYPGGASGVTIGRGYDLGYYTREQFIRDWAPYITPQESALLQACIGKKGIPAQEMAKALRGKFNISPGLADKVFEQSSLPRYADLTEKAFPGIGGLPADAKGALVSLVFNRGASMRDDDSVVHDRLEMRQIRDAIGVYGTTDGSQVGECLRQIAANIRTMRRLWVWHEDVDSWRGIIPDMPFRIIHPPQKPLRGLQLRRELEAQLVESSIPKVVV